MESDGGMTEIRFVPDDATSLDSMFAAMSECQVTSLYHNLQHLMLCFTNIHLNEWLYFHFEYECLPQQLHPDTDDSDSEAAEEEASFFLTFDLETIIVLSF